MKFDIKNLFIVLVTGALLSACNQETGSNVQLNAKKTVTNANKYPGKPSAAVDMKFQASKSPAIGETLEIEVSLKNRIAVDDMIVNFNLPNELESGDAQQYIAYGQLQSGTERSLVISVIPQADGQFYINLSVTLVVDGSKRTRGFAIPVNVGHVDPQKHLNQSSGKVTTDSTGRRIISMPAQVSE